jgi:hypothetical protein
VAREVDAVMAEVTRKGMSGLLRQEQRQASGRNTSPARYSTHKLGFLFQAFAICPSMYIQGNQQNDAGESIVGSWAVLGLEIWYQDVSITNDHRCHRRTYKGNPEPEIQP